MGRLEYFISETAKLIRKRQKCPEEARNIVFPAKKKVLLKLKTFHRGDGYNEQLSDFFRSFSLHTR